MLAIGIVVDDAIVVVENVERNIEDGLSPREATYQAMREVTGPIIAIALVLFAVFVPLAFISGLTGQFYKQFALTIAISTVISAFNSLTLSPALGAVLLKGHDAPEGLADPRSWTALFGWFFRGFNRVVQARLERYSGGVGACSRAQGARLRASTSCCSASPSACSRRCRRLRARAGQAISGRLRPAARRRHARPHRRGDPPHDRDRPEAARR